MKNSWQKIRLGDVCSLIKGVTYKSEDYATIDDGLVFLTLKSIAKGGGFNFDGVKYYKGTTHADQFVAPNDLIIANTDLTRAGDVIGAPLFVPQIDNENKYVYSMDITKIVTDESKLNRNYLYHYLLTRSVRNYMRGISNGSTVLHLRVALVNDLNIPLPPIEIQTKIARMLSDVDAEIRSTDQIIQKTEVLKQGLMRELLTKGIGHKNFKKTELGKIPDEWDIKPLDTVALVVDSLHQTPKYIVDGIPMIRVVDVKAGELDLSGCIKVSEEVYETFTNNHKPKKGDIVISRVGSFGIFAYVNESTRFCLGQNTAIISPLANSRYLYYALQSPIPSEQVAKQVVGSNQKTLSLKHIRGLFIPMPSPKEQQKIAELLGDLDIKISYERDTYSKLNIIKNGLMQDIFSQKVEVN